LAAVAAASAAEVGSMERPVGEQRLSGQSCREDGGGGREEKNAPAAIGEPDQKAESDQNADKPHASDLFQQSINIEGGAAPEVHCMGLQKDLRRPSPFIVQKREEFPFRVELGGGAELRHHLARDAVDAHTGPLRALAITRIGDLPEKSDHAQLLQ
jgi:hypothetical protein